jgi:hypothetical protein
MDLTTRLTELAARTEKHREILLTEEAAKTALVMPFLQALGYDVFNPGEVVPEFTCDVGTKKGEKVDYAICADGKVRILVECKPSSSELSINHASQLFRYFMVTDARLAILTNGVVYKFYSDIEQPHKMDSEPFFTFTMEAIKRPDLRILEKFSKASFNIDSIVEAAGGLKLESLIRKEVEKEVAEPSEEFTRIIAGRIHGGRMTPAVKENFQRLIANAFSSIVRDVVNDRLTNALNATSLPEDEEAESDSQEVVITTQEEISGYHIVQAIAAKVVDPKRVVMRDAKSYCAILLDDNNRKSLVRLHFNAIAVKYVGTFSGKDEERHQIQDLTDIYKLAGKIEARIQELGS